MRKEKLIRKLEESDYGIMVYTKTWPDKFLFFQNK